MGTMDSPNWFSRSQRRRESLEEWVVMDWDVLWGFGEVGWE
jgi:hypothetical protein